VVRAELDLAAAAARLRTLIGRSAADPLDVVGDLGSARASATPELARLEQLALEGRPDLRALQLGQARSTADLRLQESLGKIDYTIGAEYRRQQGISGRSNSLGVFVSAPLPVSNRNQGEIARAQAESEQAARQVAARRAQVLGEVRIAYHEYVAGRDLVSGIERDLLKPATRAREIAAYTYKSGGSSLLELLDAQRAFNDTMQSYVDAQAGLGRAAFRLNAVVGTEVVR
jgi:cobalt-zinc-cadmium efflux system outer membrane protein